MTKASTIGFAVTVTKEPDGLFWVKVFSQDGLLVYRTFQSEHEARKSADDVTAVMRRKVKEAGQGSVTRETMMLDRPPPSRNAERQRRKAEAEANRERVRRAAERRDRGVACYMIEGGRNMINMLVRCRWLAEDAATDRRKVEAALTAMIADSSKDFS